jgi:hypothetical protein
MVFFQVMDSLSWWRFYPIVKEYRGYHKVKHFSCAEYFRIMAFAHLRIEKVFEILKPLLQQLAQKHIIWV